MPNSPSATSPSCPNWLERGSDGPADAPGRRCCHRRLRRAGAAVAARISDAGIGWRYWIVLRAPTGGLHVRCDVNDVTAAMDLVVARKLGPVGALVCTAGVLTRSPVAELAPDEWDRVIDVSLKGTYLAARAAVAHMTDHAGAAIVGFSSGMGRKGMLNGPHYAAAKSGIEALVKSLALELGPRGIRANAVAPGQSRAR